MTSVTRETIDQWKSGMRGAVLQADDPGYEEARKVWNATVDCRPTAIARCAGAADVISAIGFATRHGMRAAVRGGGHNIAGTAVCDEGLVLDLSGMRSVVVDPQARVAWVEPGATLADFDHEAQAFGLATPLGINSTTGVAGLTLGGGFGWISRKYGTTVDNLLGAHMVTADGRHHRVDADNDPDLFWAIRGGGGNFGVVTQFEFELHPVGPEIYGGLVVYPFEQAAQVLPRYREFMDSAPDDVTVWSVFRLAPPLPFLPPEVHGKPVMVLACCHIGPSAQGADAIAPIREFGQPYGEHLGPMPYAAWQKAFDPLLTPGARNYWKSHNFARLDDGMLAVLEDGLATLPSPECEIFIGALGGRVGRVPVDATAYAHRDANFVMNIHGRWQQPADDQRCIQWTRGLFDALTPFALGSVYVNFLTQDETTRVDAAYGANYARLAQIKREYDPDNLFRGNQNIRPAQ